MQVLGYPATWPTACFIAGGCGAQVFAHTNGFGDFVLFDYLGSPWPIHQCFTDRFLLSAAAPRSPLLVVRADRRAEYTAMQVLSAPPLKKISPKDIRAVDPSELIGKPEFPIVGYVQDYLERRADQLAKRMGAFGQQLVYKTLGRNSSQLTIITADLKSYSVFADLTGTVVQRKDMVFAMTKAVPAIGLRGAQGVFIARDVKLF